ncbi:MAG: prephenate dehydrogenase [Rhodoluna sp.]|nr:prephenate dehydrogenase [Rhodoluna sp.]MBP6186512.1 prephenate dehydrogenase [Rhodoluna sp.]
MTSRTKGSVRIVGAGLLGTSIGLALNKLGIDVILVDQSPGVQSLAIDYGAGRAEKPEDQPSVVVVCVPPDVTAKVVAQQIEQFPNAVVTDVASVKSRILTELQSAGAALKHYVGSHPMAGRERGGAASGRADLFAGRVWVVSPNEQSKPEAIKVVEDLALDLGSAVIQVSAIEHDRAVAAVSHVPQLVASLTAATLLDAHAADIELAGQGIRDTTRIAASDPRLWLQILTANSEQVVRVLKSFQGQLDTVITALEDTDAPGALSSISNALSNGNLGVAKLPGKHGSKATNYSLLTVMIDDKPGELARLLTEIGEIGVNLEEIKLEHSPSSAVGLVEVSVLPDAEEKLTAELLSRNWKLVG